MAKKKRFGVSEALSRGLSETISVVENDQGLLRNSMISLSRIELDPENPRKLTVGLADIKNGLNKADPDYAAKKPELDSLTEMAETINNSGIINPIVVYKHQDKYRVVAGERRSLAAMLAGKSEIDARVFNEKPKEIDLKVLQWVENTEREDLTLSERVGNIEDILKAYKNSDMHADVNASKLSEITGLSLPQSSYYMTVIKAPADVKIAIQDGKLKNLDKAVLVSKIKQTDVRHEVLSACLKGASLKELKKLVSQVTVQNQINKLTKSNSRRGRSATRVNLGATQDPAVVKILVEAVLGQTKYQKYEKDFAKINWTDYHVATTAFKKLIHLLETVK